MIRTVHVPGRRDLLALTMCLSIVLLPATVLAGEDLCANVTPVMLSSGATLTLSGNNTGATPAGDFAVGSPFAGASAVWHAFTTTECMNVTYDYCAQSPAWTDTWGFLFTSCPAMFATGPNQLNVTDCGNGNTTYEHWSLPAGTYYIAVPIIAGSVGPYTISLTGTACPPSAGNDLCSDVTPVQLTPGSMVELTGDNTLATPTDDFVTGADFDGAAVVWHAFTLTECMNISFGFCGQAPVWELTWGFLFSDCPANQAIFPNAFNTEVCPDGNTTYDHWEVPPGTYYLAVPVIDGSVGPYTISLMGTSCGFPSNDQCQSITPQPLPVGSSLEFVGDNTGATQTGDFVEGHPFAGPVVWHAFTITGCTDVTVSYCGHEPFWANTFGILATMCPAELDVIQFSVTNDTICGDGNTIYTFHDLLDGTYYLPVLNDPGQNASGPYQITVTAVTCLTVGMEEQHISLDWSVFPNPSEGNFTLNNGSEHAITNVEVLDLAGRTVGSSTERIPPHANAEFATMGLSSGVYVVRITNSADQRSEQRIVIR